MLTTPAVGRGWQQDDAGGTPGVAAPAVRLASLSVGE
jgi:hypothetical protein